MLTALSVVNLVIASVMINNDLDSIQEYQANLSQIEIVEVISQDSIKQN